VVNEPGKRLLTGVSNHTSETESSITLQDSQLTKKRVRSPYLASDGYLALKRSEE
jgi:hypothetical protein